MWGYNHYSQDIEWTVRECYAASNDQIGSVTQAYDATNRIIYDASNGSMVYDADCSDSGTVTTFAAVMFGVEIVGVGLGFEGSRLDSGSFKPLIVTKCAMNVLALGLRLSYCPTRIGYP